MEKLVGILKNNKIVKGAMVAGGVFAAAYLLYQGAKVVKEQDGIPIEQRVKEILENAEILKYDKYEYYDLDTLMKLTDIFAELAIPEFQEFALHNREERRNAMNTDRQRYFELIKEFSENMFVLIGKQSDKLKDYEGFNDECMKVSVSIHTKDNKYLSKLVTSISYIKSSLTDEANLTIQDAQSIVAYFTNLLKSQPEILVHLVKYLAEEVGQVPGQILPSIKTALFDQLYLEKGFEEEDFLKISLTQEYLQDPITQRVQKMYIQTMESFLNYHTYTQ